MAKTAKMQQKPFDLAQVQALTVEQASALGNARASVFIGVDVAKNNVDSTMNDELRSLIPQTPEVRAAYLEGYRAIVKQKEEEGVKVTTAKSRRSDVARYVKALDTRPETTAAILMNPKFDWQRDKKLLARDPRGNTETSDEEKAKETTDKQLKSIGTSEDIGALVQILCKTMARLIEVGRSKKSPLPEFIGLSLNAEYIAVQKTWSQEFPKHMVNGILDVDGIRKALSLQEIDKATAKKAA